MMRKCVVETGLLSWKNLRLVRTDKGKPFVPDLKHVQFSVSHHGRLTVLAAEIFETKDGVCSGTQGMSEVDFTQSSTSSPPTVLASTSTTPADNELTSPLSALRLENSNMNEPQLETSSKCTLKPSSDKGDSPKTTKATSEITVGKIEYPSLGVDICNQDLPRNTAVPEFFRLMRRNFHEEEWRYILSGCNESTQLGRFYRMWALKESFVKATGTGIAVPLSEICFHVASELDLGAFVYDTKLVLRDRAADEWIFEETLLMTHYCVAVAICNVSPGRMSVDKRYEEVTFSDVEELMEDLEVDEEEELFFMSRDFVKKQLRPWDK